VQSFHEKSLTSRDHQDDLEEGSIESAASSDDGSQSVQEPRLDMLERLTTAEQAHNVDLFEQLRTWQAEQREQLMRQQQQQLLQLHAEQQAAESRLLVQRQNLWSSSKNVPVSAVVDSLPPKSSVRKLQVGLPQAIATSTLALARLRLQESVMVNSDLAAPTPGEGSECQVPNGSRTSPPPAEEQINVGLESDTPDSPVESDDLHPLLHSVSGAVSKHKVSGNKPDIEVSGVEPVLSPLPSDADTTLKPGTGISASEYDELPVGGGAAQGKSFEELVLEQLEKERQLSESQQRRVHGVVQESKRSKCFLKKGDGTARFTSSERQFPTHKVTEDFHTMKHAAPSETRLQPSRPSRSAPAVDSVVKPMQRKSCLKNRTAESEISGPQSDFVTDNVVCTRTPTTSTPNRKRFQTSADGVFHLSAADPSSRGRDSIGDASYLACMQARVKKEEAEAKELWEFELLENYVDDNASFTSNVSSISEILARHDAEQPVRSYDNKHSVGTRVKCSSVSKEVSVTGKQQMEKVYTDEDSIDSNGDADDDDDDVNVTLIDDAPVVSAAGSSTALVEDNAQPTALQAIYRKIASMNGKYIVTEMQSVSAVDQRLLLSGGNQRTVPHLPTGFIGDGTEESAADQPGHESVQQVSHENDDVEHCAIQKPLRQVRDSNTPDNTGTVTENVFSDEREWNDSLVSSPVHASNDLHRNRQQNSSSPSCAVTATSSEEQLSAETGYHTADARSESPPTSRLAQKLFPKLKPQKPKAAELRNSSQTGTLAVPSNHVVDTTDTASTVASVALREKLAQLEVEIQQFRNENAVLATLRKEREQVVDRLKKEMAEFERQKADELQRLEEHKAEEMKKLKKERKVFETYQKAARAGPDKKDREEIEMLKSQLNELQDEIKRKEQKWIASNQRLRDRVEQLEQENTELRDEIRVLEQRRLQEWKPRKREPEPAAKSDAKLVESAMAGQNAVPRSALKPVEKFQKQTERQKHIPSTKNTKPEQTSNLPSGDSDIKPSSQTNLSLEIADEMLQQRNSVPKPQTISPLAASTNFGGDAAIRKTAAKSVTALSTDVSDRPYDQVQHPDGKVERICPDGSREILFTNGTRKQISADGQTIIVSFFNGDIKQMLPDGRVVYCYADAQTTHTTYADGLQIFQFANGQVEKHYIDGTKEIQFPDQTIKYLFSNGSAESVFLDGTIVHVDSTGDKQITFPNGQKEVHTALFKKREYPDGTTKTVFTDGRQETRYSNGRVRVKDASGVVVLDQLT